MREKARRFDTGGLFLVMLRTVVAPPVPTGGERRGAASLIVQQA
jgi:hypothetical protein